MGPKYVSRPPESIGIIEFLSIFPIHQDLEKFRRKTPFQEYTAILFWTESDRDGSNGIRRVSWNSTTLPQTPNL